MFILADDLTGAADCGVACVASGLSTTVALQDSADEIHADVLAHDADTRRLDATCASREVARLMSRYSSIPDLLLFKKIDSTLRGNLAGELAAALSALRAQNSGAIAVMAPAFPAIGRTTVGGMQLAHGSPLHELDIWRLQGINGRAHIPEMLRPAGLKCAHLTLDSVRGTLTALASQMNSLANDADVLVCDAETDADLLAIASASMQLSRRILWVGSAGLAYQLLRAAGIVSREAASVVPLPPRTGPSLFVIGSLSQRSVEQVRVLTASSPVIQIAVPPHVLLAGADSSQFEHQLCAAVQRGQDVVLSPCAEPQLDLSQRPHLATGLARMASSVQAEIGALIASGGETARAVLQSWGVTRLRLLGELDRGIPIAITENWRRKLPVITKAGDFGGPDALLGCYRFLRGANAGATSPDDLRKVVQ